MAYPNRRHHEYDFVNFSDETDIRCIYCKMLHDISCRQCPYCGQVASTKNVTASSYWDNFDRFRKTYPDDLRSEKEPIKTEEELFVEMLLKD